LKLSPNKKKFRMRAVFDQMGVQMRVAAVLNLGRTAVHATRKNCETFFLLQVETLP